MERRGGGKRRRAKFWRQEEPKEVRVEEFLSRKWKLLKCFGLKRGIDFPNPLRPSGRKEKAWRIKDT
jgi:hypothetical protein